MATVFDNPASSSSGSATVWMEGPPAAVPSGRCLDHIGSLLTWLRAAAAPLRLECVLDVAPGVDEAVSMRAWVGAHGVGAGELAVLSRLVGLGLVPSERGPAAFTTAQAFGVDLAVDGALPDVRAVDPLQDPTYCTLGVDHPGLVDLAGLGVGVRLHARLWSLAPDPALAERVAELRDRPGRHDPECRHHERRLARVEDAWLGAPASLEARVSRRLDPGRRAMLELAVNPLREGGAVLVAQATPAIVRRPTALALIRSLGMQA